MKKPSVIVSLSLGFIGAIAPLLAAQANPDLQQQADEIATYLTRTMDTSAQAAANPGVANVQMTACVVQLQDLGSASDDAIYLYQEQFVQPRIDQPYRQRFLQITPHSPSQSVRSLAYKPAVLEDWVGLCDRSLADRTVSLDALGEPICSVFLRPFGTGYLGRTPIGGCPANFRGAVRITNHIVLHENGMNTWDRGFDAEGRQVWGAEDQAYEFRWTE
jgi:hypothetical protein